jgi:hypothetical protein
LRLNNQPACLIFVTPFMIYEDWFQLTLAGLLSESGNVKD